MQYRYTLTILLAKNVFSQTNQGLLAQLSLLLQFHHQHRFQLANSVQHLVALEHILVLWHLKRFNNRRCQKHWHSEFNLKTRQSVIPPEMISLLLSFGCMRNHWIEIFDKSMWVPLRATIRKTDPKHWRPSKSNEGVPFSFNLLCSSNCQKHILKSVMQQGFNSTWQKILPLEILQMLKIKSFRLLAAQK